MHTTFTLLFYSYVFGVFCNVTSKQELNGGLFKIICVTRLKYFNTNEHIFNILGVNIHSIALKCSIRVDKNIFILLHLECNISLEYIYINKMM